MNVCPVCEERFSDNSLRTVSDHFLSEAQSSDPSHVMWLNRNISRTKLSENELEKAFQKFYDFSEEGLTNWIRKRFVDRFFSDDPNIFVLEMQKPSKYTIMGYVTEHYHFLKQWVKSCAYIMAKTDFPEIQKYELDNITEEYFGLGGQSAHMELLLKMGESVDLSREVVMNSRPLPKTEKGLRYWEHVCKDGHWLDGMASMHSLELIADKNVKDYGAKYSYFRPEILDGGITKEASTFLRAGYEADQYHSGDALNLIGKYASQMMMETEVQSYFLRSSEFFFDYLEARYERGKMYEKEL